MQYLEPSCTPELRRSRPFVEEKSRKEAVMFAAMGDEDEQRPVVRLEGRLEAEVEGWECWVSGFWKTGEMLERVRMESVGWTDRSFASRRRCFARACWT